MRSSSLSLLLAGAWAATPAACGSNTNGPTGPTPPHPNPIISRTGQVFAMPAAGANAVIDGYYHGDGSWNAGMPSVTAPAWVAIKLQTSAARVLVSWDDGGTYNYRDPAGTTVYGLPASYHIDVSADSTDGADGTWTTAVPEVQNRVRTRAHSFDFAGKSWVKMVITGTPTDSTGAQNPVKISELDVHDISATGSGLPDDTWFFMGDSITAFAYQRTVVQEPSFAEAVSMASSAYFPAMINGGIGGETTAGALARVDEDLALNPDYRYFAITYGTNDEWGNKTDASGFKANLQMLIDKIVAAGRTPVISHIPYSNDGNHNTLDVFNAAIDELTMTNHLMAGPDFSTYFMQHADELMTDKVHPGIPAQVAMNKLWADAVRAIYP
jgi:acyl-CoA thioesterase-1